MVHGGDKDARPHTAVETAVCGVIIDACLGSACLAYSRFSDAAAAGG
jgi:hypothetical protein